MNLIQCVKVSAFYSCHNKEHKSGTGFVVSKRVEHTVMHFEARTLRLCWLKIEGKFFNYGIINVHALTENKSEGKKDASYDDLRRLYDNCPKRDIKIVIGDMNGQTGREEIYC
jgi:hypothetical protein